MFGGCALGRELGLRDLVEPLEDPQGRRQRVLARHRVGHPAQPLGVLGQLGRAGQQRDPAGPPQVQAGAGHPLLGLERQPHQGRGQAPAVVRCFDGRSPRGGQGIGQLGQGHHAPRGLDGAEQLVPQRRDRRLPRPALAVGPDHLADPLSRHVQPRRDLGLARPVPPVGEAQEQLADLDRLVGPGARRRAEQLASQGVEVERRRVFGFGSRAKLRPPAVRRLREPLPEVVERRDDLVARLLADAPHEPDVADRQVEELADGRHAHAVEGVGGAGAQAQDRHERLGVGLVQLDRGARPRRRRAS